MPTSRYFIHHNNADDNWMIRYGEEEYGPYMTKDEAVAFAIDAARTLSQRGEAAEVCLMGENGHFHAEWVSSREEPRKSDGRA